MAGLVALGATAGALALALGLQTAAGPGDDGYEQQDDEGPPASHTHGNTMVGLLAGPRWAYDPVLAQKSRSPPVDDPLIDEAPLGLAIRAPFAYWWSPGFQYALELGWARSTHVFESGSGLTTDALSAEVSGRWFPWPDLRRLWPYVGGSIGFYYTNATGSAGSQEDGNGGVGAFLGTLVPIVGSLSAMIEVRGVAAREARGPGALSVQPGGFFALAGLSVSLEPDPK